MNRFFGFQLLWASMAMASVDVKVGNPIVVSNHTASKQNIVGLRTPGSSQLSVFGASSWTNSVRLSHGQAYVDGRIGGSYQSWVIDAAPGQSLNLSLSTGVPIPTSAQALYQLGTCSQLPTPTTAPAMTLAQLSSALQLPGYYDANERFVDQLSTRAGRLGGAFLDHYQGETQALIAVPTGSFNINSSAANYNLNAFPSAMPWMAMIMAQEYFGWDWQLLMSVWAKETAYMLSNASNSNWHAAVWTNSDGAYGPGEVESSTFMSRAMAYPKFFPYDSCLVAPNSRDISSAMSVCGFTDKQFAARYMGVDHTHPDSASIVNAVIASGFTLQFNFDLLSKATSLGFKQALSASPDPKIGLCAAIPLYNLGINSGAEVSLIAPQNWSTLACKDFPTGNGNYRTQITDMVAQWENEAAKSTSSYLDKWITLDDVRRFYFGENSSVSQPWTANGKTQQGGLMMHFNLGDAAKQAMWNDLSSAFALQAAHWGGSKISLRYDWLVLLRIAKKYLDLNKGPIQSEEAQQWLENRASKTTADGRALDTHWPFATLAVNAAAPGLTATVNAEDLESDDRGIAQVEWTVDENWGFWSTSYVVQNSSSTAKSSVWDVQIPADQALLRGSPQNLYVRVTDSCGNAIVIQSPVQVNTPVLHTAQIKSSWNLQTLEQIQDQLRQNPTLNWSLRSVNGSLVAQGLGWQKDLDLPKAKYWLKVEAK